MNPVTFRRDRWLRTSAYHLATWSLTAFVLQLRAESPSGVGAGGVAVFVVLLAAAFLSSLTHERRVGKMAGPAGEPVFAGAGRLWAGVFGMLGVAAVALPAASRASWLYPVGMLVVGAAFAAWGRRAGFAWYVGLGAAMAGAALADGALAATGGPFVAVRLLVLGLALPAAALVTNRRYLWFRPGR